MALPPNISCFIRRLERSVYENEAIALFAAFARFEYALKRTNYAKKGSGNACMANWKKFATDKKGEFEHVSIEGLNEAKEFFDNKPPRKQVYDGKTMRWQTLERRNNHSHLQWYVDLVKTVRNNFFHGEKIVALEQTDIEVEPSRNLLLIKHSLVMLEAFLECDENLKETFLAPIP